MYRCTAKKLTHRSEPVHKRDEYDAVPERLSFIGVAPMGPMVGDRFTVYDEKSGNMILSTSLVLSVLAADETGGEDKLVLPSNFPDRERIEVPPLKKGDRLFATLNSIYHVSDMVWIGDKDGKAVH